VAINRRALGRADLTASSTPLSTAIDDNDDELLAAVRARFKHLTEGSAGTNEVLAFE
jgi:hypothetical protein